MIQQLPTSMRHDALDRVVVLRVSADDVMFIFEDNNVTARK